jgi:hypothetical protein
MLIPRMATVLGAALLLTTSWARAETVFVKYRGPVRLDSFRCAEPASSFVHRVCYRHDKQYLIVLLGNTYYHYCRMPPSVVQQWLAAPSQGRYYNAMIKGNYDCRLGGIPND